MFFCRVFVIVLWPENKSTPPVKRFCTVFLVLFSVLFLRNVAEGATADKTLHSPHTTISHHKVAHTLPKASMEKKKPAKGYTAMLFRMGIEGKNIALFYQAHIDLLNTEEVVKDSSVNHAWLKHILFSSGFIVFPPEFLSAFSSHAPPALC